jgi:hypothetical protein
MDKIKILFFSGNPEGTTPLKLDEEAREIQTKVRAAEYRDSLELITRWAVRPDDLLQSLNEHKPHIVHFSGHGSPTEEIILLDQQGNPKPVSKAALVSLFYTLKDNIRVVLLNACFSRPQAEAITEEIDCAIGMTRAIGDEAAIAFAASFYRAIGFGRSIREAFDQGKTALLLEGIPEENIPELVTRHTITPESIVLIAPNSSRDFNLDSPTSRTRPALEFSNDLFLPTVQKVYGEWTRYIQVVPRCLNEDGVAKCQARLLRVMALRNDNWESLSDEPFELTWASNDKTEYDLFPGVAQRLNVAWVSRTYGFIAAVDLRVCFDPRYIWNIDGPIRFDVRVLSINCSPADISIEATIVQRGTGNTPPEIKAALRRADVLVNTHVHYGNSN